MNASDVEEKDRQILQLLARDGRMSYTDLGKATGLSTSAVHQRVKRLEQRGLILGYGATVNHAEIGLPLTAFISIRPIDPSQPDDSPERLRDIPEIESCWSVAGEESYILKIRVATPEDLEDLLARIRSAANVVHAHHDRALHAVREPAGHLSLPGAVRKRRRHHPVERAGPAVYGPLEPDDASSRRTACPAQTRICSIALPAGTSAEDVADPERTQVSEHQLALHASPGCLRSRQPRLGGVLPGQPLP